MAQLLAEIQHHREPGFSGPYSSHFCSGHPLWTLECSWARAIFPVSHQEGCLPAGRALLTGLTENGQQARARMPVSGNRAAGRPHRVFRRTPAAPRERQPLGLCLPPGARNCRSELT
ncbi:unnamed protein product [Rangifer tarandus platyrhynchus]|uniref:Uncharacterized protein n=1 Tax=Rangifer tarandus platyrhynchus TaxID=3082113 RepID=A0AC59YYP3_RANTA